MISISVSNLTKKYNRKTVLKNIEFSHSSGILGISGSNGSGKSTLMKCLAGLMRPNSGTVDWKFNNEILSRTELKSHIGFAAPYISLYEDLTVTENLNFLSEVSHQNLAQTQLQELLVRTETENLKDKLYKSLSTGQQQRVKLASSLIRNPKVLFWDEPGSNLDADGHNLVRNLLQLQKKNGSLIFLASNDPDEIVLCDEILALSH